MSSWWVKGDTNDTTERETDGLKNNVKIIRSKRIRSKGSRKYYNQVTQPTQNDRVRGEGYHRLHRELGHHNKRTQNRNKYNRDCITALDSRH